MTNTTAGRHHLRQWEDSKPRDFFAADANLQNVLRRYMGQRLENEKPRLAKAGTEAATTLDAAAKIEDEIGNHPRLQRWSNIGERLEQIEFHPHHDLAGLLIWESGIMALQATPGNTVLQMGLFYLFNHNGEAGHMCALACTSGLIKVLQQVADEKTRARFLPALFDTDYTQMQHGAQFLTEIQGGSDVGANAVIATDAGDGTWRIHGEKWFCSNINSDQFLMTARPENADDGTRGLGLFLVPRTLEDGSTNGFYIRRLKDKLGTRTLASAELDFVDAVAYPIGPLDRGFKNVVELVLNTSRAMNSVACTGIMRRAAIEANSYACHRPAFGQPIASYPLIQEAIADLVSETTAAVASSFYVAHLWDLIETGKATDAENGIFRLLVNVNKYLTSVRGSQMVHRAIEVLGGNGAIESFSILPRLYRDMVVLESWEGTHNVLCLQVLRDITRLNLYVPYATEMIHQLDAIQHPTLKNSAAVARDALNSTSALLKKLMDAGEAAAQAHARRFVDTLGVVTQAILLLSEAQWELDNRLVTPKADIITYFVNRHLRRDYDPLADGDYLARLERLLTAV